MTTAGGVEEDFIKCMAPTYLGDFHLKGRDLRERGINRIGNLLVPNDNYCKFEDWIMPILDKMLEEQKEQVFMSRELICDQRICGKIIFLCWSVKIHCSFFYFECKMYLFISIILISLIVHRVRLDMNDNY